MNGDQISRAFIELAAGFVVPRVEEIYRNIYSEVRNAPPELLAGKITSLESKSINAFFMKLEEQAGQTAMAAMRAAGVPEVRIPMIWVKVRGEVKAPHARLCNQQNYTMPQRSDSVPSEPRPSAPPVGKYILVFGAVVEVVAWLFLPAGNIWAPIVKGAGILLLGGGAYQVVQEQKAPRITLTEEAVKRAKAESAKAIQEICRQQCRLNTEVFTGWLNDLSQRLTAECANQL